MRPRPDLLTLRQSLLKERDFLHKLYSSPDGKGNKRTIATASNSQLDTLLRVLSCLVKGDIPFKSSLLKIVAKKRKLKYLCETFEHIENLLKSEKEKKVSALKPLGRVFEYLLYALFQS